jgi:DNA-binding transcriptional LysR family regulator
MLAAGDLVMVVPARAAAGWSAGEQEQCALAVRRAPEELGTLRYWLLWHERSRLDPRPAGFVRG